MRFSVFISYQVKVEKSLKEHPSREHAGEWLNGAVQYRIARRTSVTYFSDHLIDCAKPGQNPMSRTGRELETNLNRSDDRALIMSPHH
jgi:hypothetical protein